MKNKTRFLSGAFVLMFVLSLIMFGSANAEEMRHKHGKDADMTMHHMHTMMSHGLVMVTEGSNMVMLGEMKMAPGVDKKTLQHGQHMIKEGKDLITRALSGPEMTAMMKKHAKAPLMEYTHELGEAMLKITDILEKMPMEDMSSPDMMTMHHMHIMINHALGMAAEGSNMVMLGRMGMAKDVDKFSVEHGKMMMKDAHALLNEVFEGKAMKEMHEKGVKMDNAMMAETHNLGEAAGKVIDLLEKMPE